MLLINKVTVVIMRLCAAFTVFSLLFIVLVGCNSGSGVPVQVGEDSPASNAQDQITDLHYASPEEFWLSNPGCSENTIGVKAYVGEAYPYTCVLHGNEWMWTKVCEHNGLIYIEGESWFEGENCGRSWYLCKDGYTMKDPLGRPGSCGYSLSSSSIANSSSSSKIWHYLNPKISYGEVRDSRDNQIYKTIVLGNQVWMAENLNYNSKYSVCEQCEKYGRLYSLGDAESVCPTGWHSATGDDWLLLNEFWQRTEKSPLSLYEWNVEDGRTTDDFGLSILPAGGIYGYRDESYHGREDVGDRAIYFAGDGEKQIIISKTGIEFPIKYNIGAKCPVRCIRDSLVQPKFGTLIDSRDKKSYKTVFIGNQEWMAENLNLERPIEAHMLGNVCPEGWHLPDTTEWNTLFAHTIGGKTTAGRELSGTYEGLDYYGFSGEGDALYWSSSVNAYSRFYVVSNDCGSYCGDWSVGYQLGNDGPYSVRCVKGTGFGSWHKILLGEFKDSRDGQTYITTTIGTQTWMAENLNFETENSYCYDNNPANCSIYGRLYTWSAAMDSTGMWTTSGKGCGYNSDCSPTYPVRGVCPQGWHLPSKSEWETMIDAVGGRNNAGPKLKSTSNWQDRGNGTDDDYSFDDYYGFSALPAGWRYIESWYHEGKYSERDYYTCFWSSTEYHSFAAYYMLLSNFFEAVSIDEVTNMTSSKTKDYGFSVRCVKD